MTLMNKPPHANTVWLGLLESILDQGIEEVPRGKRTLEIIGKMTKWDMAQPIVTVAARKLGMRFTMAEAWWIASGSNRVDEIKPYSKAIANFSDDGLTFRGAYGPKIMDQLPWVAEQLAKDPSTRQAVLSIWRERPGPSKDYPCTLGAQWILRRIDDTLHLHCQVTMRSSDAWMGVPYDITNFAIQTAFLIAYMRTAYQEQFKETIHLGTLTFTAGSQHLYEEHFELAKNCTFEPEPAFTYQPIAPELYQSDPYRLLKHVKSLADRDPRTSPFYVPTGNAKDKLSAQVAPGYLGELYDLGSQEKNTGFDAQPNPRGIK